jgi:hypothetical protein
VLNHRSSINTVVQALLDKGETEKAKQLILFSLEKMPDKGVRFDYTAAEAVNLLFKVGEKDKAIEIAKTIGDRAIEMSNFLTNEGGGFTGDLRNNVIMLNILQRALYENGENELAKKYEAAFQKLMGTFNEGGSRGGY